jgi:HPt (histidine-containing phosphotransfer) domain-containing protein
MDSAEQIALAEALGQMWARFLPEMKQRVAILESAAAAFASCSLPPRQQQDASAAAHKLAGVLGTFGLTRGTILARELEILYSRDEGPAPADGPSLISIAAELRTLLENRI